MKIARMIVAAGLVVASLGASAAASAQDYGHGRYERGYDDRGDRGRYHDDRGHHYGWDRSYGHQRCRTEWHHHHRVTRCFR